MAELAGERRQKEDQPRYRTRLNTRETTESSKWFAHVLVRFLTTVIIAF